MRSEMDEVCTIPSNVGALERLKACPCCGADHGVLIDTDREAEVETKGYRCSECRSTWQVLIYPDGYPSLGTVVRSGSAGVSVGRYNESARDVEAKARKARKGAKKSAEGRLVTSGLREAGLV